MCMYLKPSMHIFIAKINVCTHKPASVMLFSYN